MNCKSVGLFLSVFLVAVAFASGQDYGKGQAERKNPTRGAESALEGIRRITHVVWIIQENHSFDNYFGTFPGADGIPPGTCLPVLPRSQRCIKSFHMPKGMPYWDLAHQWEIAHAAYDNGTMDGFVWAEGSSYTMGYYDDRDIPNYWKYALQYTLCDQFFSSLMGPSGPNHVYIVAAQSGGLIDNVASVKDLEDDIDDPDGFTFAALMDRLDKAQLSWKY